MNLLSETHKSSMRLYPTIVSICFTMAYHGKGLDQGEGRLHGQADPLLLCTGCPWQATNVESGARISSVDGAGTLRSSESLAKLQNQLLWSLSSHDHLSGHCLCLGDGLQLGFSTFSWVGLSFQVDLVLTAKQRVLLRLWVATILLRPWG